MDDFLAKQKLPKLNPKEKQKNLKGPINVVGIEKAIFYICHFKMTLAPGFFCVCGLIKIKFIEQIVPIIVKLFQTTAKMDSYLIKLELP